MNERHALESTELPEDLVALVKPELVPGERLIWAARPLGARPAPWAVGVKAALWIVGSLAIGLFSFAASVGAFGPYFLKVDGFLALLMVCSAVAAIVSFLVAIFAFGATISERKLNQGASYALTDRRAIVWRANRFKRGIEIHSYPRGSIKSVNRVDYPDGSGDVSFTPAGSDEYDFSLMSCIPDARLVEHYIRQVLIAAPAE